METPFLYRMFRLLFHSLILRGILFLFMLPAVSHAQITLDGSLGPKGPLTGPNYAIDAKVGQLHGNNLFHSFGQFNVQTGESATFTGPSTVENVIGRVTGGQQSLIDGQLRSEMPQANLYLLNPSGVLFGPNATLDVPGSFHVSTADYLRLADGEKFFANLSQQSVLTSAPPAAFGFLGSNPAPISIQGSSLQVPEGKTLSVVSGDIQITGGSLSAPRGQLDLASVASAGEVIPTVSEQGPDLKLEGFSRLGKIEASQGARINTDGAGGGSVVIRGGRLVVNNASISSNTQGNTDGARVGIDAQIAEEVVITNAGRIESTVTGSGNGGSTELKVKQLTLTDGARIDTSTSGDGRGGTLSVTATDTISISGRDSKGSKSGLFSNALGKGDGGKVSVSASTLTMSDRGTIDAHTAGDGNAGNIEVQVGTLTLTGGARILASSGFGEYKEGVLTFSGTGGPGRGGDVTVHATESISIAGGDSDGTPSGLSSGTVNKGDAGKIFVSTPLLQIDRAGISANTLGDGNAGDIDVQVGRLTLTGGAAIVANVGIGKFITSPFPLIYTGGPGRGGNLTIHATEAISISGESSLGFQSVLGTSTQKGRGASGQLFVSTPVLDIHDGGGIASDSLGESTGNAGDIRLEVGKLTMSGDAFIHSGTEGPGQGGDIQVQAQQIELTNNKAAIAASSSGPGNAGNIAIHADNTFRSRNSVVSTSSTQSGGGKIDLSAGHIVELVDSQITTTVQGGAGDAGNITIDPHYVILNDSQVIARAVEGNGGNITIGADVFLASPASIVDASSQTGISGTIDIRGAVNDLSGSIAPLPQGYLSTATLSENRCAGRLREGQVSSFVVTGLEGMPLQPAGILPSPLYEADAVNGQAEPGSNGDRQIVWQELPRITLDVKCGR